MIDRALDYPFQDRLALNLVDVQIDGFVGISKIKDGNAHQSFRSSRHPSWYDNVHNRGT